jgi:hypothetical protein
VRGDARPEAGDLDQQLGPGETKETDVPGDHVVLPHVIGDRDVDVTLQVCVIGEPPAGLRVEVQLLGLLAPGGAALPRKHRTVEPGRPRRRPRRPEAGDPVLQ